MNRAGGSEMAKRVLALGLSLWAAACGNGTNMLGPGIPPGGGGDGGGTNSEVPLAEVAPGGAGLAEVRLQILAPAAQAVLGVATAPEIRARVRSVLRGTDTPSADPILPDSVRFFVATDDPKGPSATGALTGPSFESEYAGRADLSGLPTGQYALIVTASTREGAEASTRVDVLVDAGPRITILSPRSQAAHKGSVAVDVQIEATPFELGPPPEAFVGGTAVTLEPGSGPGRFRAVLEFNKFTPPLIDDQLFRVRATNRQGTPAEARVVFFVDDDGPLFSETEPADGQVVGGVVRIAAKLSDRAGVLGPSVTAFVGNRVGEGFELELRPEGTGGVYSALFDTRKLTACRRGDPSGLCVVWPNLSFRASDLLGNERVLAYDIGIDNQPPTIDLDPPEMRVRRWSDGWQCSWSFDPLGRYSQTGDMPNDGCRVGQVFDLRARVEDAGNWASGLKLPPTATVEPSSVHAYVLDDTAQPLAVDVDGDSFCDAVNPLLVPTTMPPRQSKEILAVRLTAIAPKGDGNFTPDPSIALDPGLTGVCGVGTDPEAPPPLCIAQTLTLATGYYSAKGPEPAIWGIDPIKGAYCIGAGFDAEPNQIADGWACVVVAATDRVGNASVSHPLRVYIDRQLANQAQSMCPAPPASAGPPPDCTGRYDRATNAIIPGTCQGVRFPGGQVRDF
jgi:hypothetical protein